MHTYSTDNDLRLKIVGFLGIGSYIFIQALVNLVSSLNATLPYGIDVSVPATGSVFTVAYLLFGSVLWNHWIFRRLRIVKTPCLSGKWTGNLQSSYDNEDDNDDHEKTRVEVQIRQSWRKMSVELDAPDSSSRSLGATVLTKEGKPELTYHYRSEPDYDAPDTMHIHYGTTSLTFHEGEGRDGADVLNGVYYTSPGRDSHGHIHLSRVNED